MKTELLALIVPLVLIAAAAVAATVLLRFWRGSVGRRAGPLELLHVIAVGPRERIALIKVVDRYLVVGITPGSISRVAELDHIYDTVNNPQRDKTD